MCNQPDDDHDEGDYIEPEPTTLCDELRPAARGMFPQSTEELTESFDPYGTESDKYLWENH